MRHGSSIMNIFNGDAEKSMFTMSNMMTGSEEEKKRRAQDVALLMLDPYFLMRSLAIFFWEVGRELWQAWQQKRNDVYPRLNRLEHGYPFLRAAMCTLMRDISTNIAIMDMMRGSASIYMLYLGYDEVAHHSGPWTDDAFGDLKRLDRNVRPFATRGQRESVTPLRSDYSVRSWSVLRADLLAALRPLDQRVYRTAAPQAGLPWPSPSAATQERRAFRAWLVN